MYHEPHPFVWLNSGPVRLNTPVCVPSHCWRAFGRFLPGGCGDQRCSKQACVHAHVTTRVSSRGEPARAAETTHHGLDGLQQVFAPRCSGGWTHKHRQRSTIRSMIGVHAEASGSAGRQLPSDCALTWPLPLVQTKRALGGRERGPSSWKTTHPITLS